MDYFEVERLGFAVCSDPECPCPETPLDDDNGYLMISDQTVEFRRGLPTLRAVREKFAGRMVMFGPGVAAPIALCRVGAERRRLDLRTASADFSHWWKTGLVPLRPTPLAGAGESAVQRPEPPQAQVPRAAIRDAASLPSDAPSHARSAATAVAADESRAANPEAGVQPEVSGVGVSVRELRKLRERFDTLGNGRHRPGEIHPGVTMNLDQAIEALTSGLDPGKRPISPAQVGRGLERLAAFIDTPEWQALGERVTPPDQKYLLRSYVSEMWVLAKGVAANDAPPVTPATRVAAHPESSPSSAEPAAPVFTRCPECHAVFSIRPDVVGKTTRCKRCRHSFTIALHEGSGPRQASHSTPADGNQQHNLIGKSRLPRGFTGWRGLMYLAGLLILLAGGLVSALWLTRPVILECVVHEFASIESDGKPISKSITFMVKIPCSDNAVLDPQDFSLVAADGRTVAGDSIIRLPAGKVSLLDTQDEFSEQSRALIQFKLPGDLAADSTLWLKHGWRQARQIPETRKHTQSTMRFNSAATPSVNQNARPAPDTHVDREQSPQSPVEKQPSAAEARRSTTSKRSKPDEHLDAARDRAANQPKSSTPASKPSPPAPARSTRSPAELIKGKWSGKYPTKNLRGELEILDETWEFQKNGNFRRVIMLDGATATLEGTYRVVDAKSLELDNRAGEKLVWKMTLTPDALVIAHPTKPEPGSIGGAGTSTLERTKDAAKTVVSSSAGPKEYQGKWKLERIQWAEEGSTSTLVVSSPDWVRNIAGNQLTEVITDDDGTKREEYTITIDTTTVPHKYTMVATSEDKNETIGIISATKDELRMCFQKRGRPEDFTITQGQSVKDKHVYTFKRQR